MNRQITGSPSSASAQISSTSYQSFREFLEKACGILLGENKQYLVASRLNKIMAQHEITDLNDLIVKMSSLSHRSLKESVVDAMTTNETLWFRDTHPFEVFKNKILPERIKGARGSMRIWSAACSSGQEPYSLSMIYEEYKAKSLGVPSLDIIGTDLSRTMLDLSKSAEYDGLSLGRGLSDQRLRQFFEPVDGDVWRVKREYSQRTRFQSLNLMDSYASLGKFDAVFCRNVLIYFSAELKRDILTRIHATLKPGGYLVLGASEGLTGLSDLYKMVHCHPGIIYQAV
ncbi:MAG: chemotaxis protein methyltransferase CheR [Pseudohongiellaceae bacterium]|jgi:chemotaxis protein methyltransferase CheR